MGCKASKMANGQPGDVSTTAFPDVNTSPGFPDSPGTVTPVSPPRTNANGSRKRHAAGADAPSHSLYKYLVQAQRTLTVELQDKILEHCNAKQAAYTSPNTKSTPLHMAVRLLDTPGPHEKVQVIVERLIQAYPDAVKRQDSAGNFPLHYAIAPSPGGGPVHHTQAPPASAWKHRKHVVQLIMSSDIELADAYMNRHDLYFPDLHCSALYRALQQMPDDFDHAAHTGQVAATVQFIALLREMVDAPMMSNASDGDKPLALLYRRFTRQFDLAEKFFPGDNSAPDIVAHRQRYKVAAGNTWKIIELLLRPDDDDEQHRDGSGTRTTSSSQQQQQQRARWHMVHRAVQIETPPDLLRYIVETNAHDLTVPDTEAGGWLPIHYAAMAKKVVQPFPSYYTKYVVDELLYKYPEAAQVKDAKSRYPLQLAVQAGKQWIGGGVKSLYDAYPAALQSIDLSQHEALQRALTMDGGGDDDNDAVDVVEEKKDTVIQDEHHDAIMLVQGSHDVAEIVTSMWAHEEDAGVQMLGTVALTRLIEQHGVSPLRIALSGIAAVVNAMKAHPNEVIVQEKACQCLALLAPADGHVEVSVVASGAVAAVVGAMQAHVSDPGVQEAACAALVEMMQHGGADRATIVASVSGVTAILNALSAHPMVEGVQLHAIKALRTLTDYANDGGAYLPTLEHQSQTEGLLEHAGNTFETCQKDVMVLMERLDMHKDDNDDDNNDAAQVA